MVGASEWMTYARTKETVLRSLARGALREHTTSACDIKYMHMHVTARAGPRYMS